MISVRQVYESYFTIIPRFSKDESEQEEIENVLISEQLKQQIIQDLKALKENDSEFVEIHKRIYKRDNKTLVQLKILRGFKCQICNHIILKSNGKKYIEAAHIKPKSQKGREWPNNILILCPNHHKEFDYGNLKILQHTDDVINFMLNDCEYNIRLSIG